MSEDIEMIGTKTSLCLPIFLLAASGFLGAQESNPTANGQSPMQSTTTTMTQSGTQDNVPIYRIQVVGREVPAINYFHRHGSTKIEFQGTSLLPAAKGSAKVDAQLGRTVINAEFQGLSPANGFGTEYLTYVLWAITPEGRPMNLGEVLPTGSKDKNQITVTTNLQAFGLIITAEPYYAVSMPSDIVVMQNMVGDRTQGVIEQVNAHYSLLPRGAYAETAGRHTVLHPVTRDERSPLELYEAQNAMQIAEAAGADKYAADTIATAKTAMKNAEDINSHSRDRKETITFAREAVQSAEDARIITIRKIKAEDDEAARQARLNAEQQAQQSQLAAQQAQMAAQQSQLAAEQEAAQRAKADAARAEAEAQAEKARQAQQQAEQAAQQAAQQANDARERLRNQLNQVLQTTETARGLIVNMSDVLFDFNKYTLKPEAREKLAKVSGILLAYPDLKVQVEGYTDNIGSDEYNQKLSEQRADGVREYLVAQSVSDSNVTAKGFGMADPVADNTTNQGRAKNRRVELVVSGGAIGIQPGAQPGQGAVAPQPNPANTPQTSTNEGNTTGVSNPPPQ
jgi:outer membrane protein OmpA-like peptidoglycan-associated protein